MKLDEVTKEIELQEASYKGNVGFQEMVEFYRKANDSELKQMESLVKKNDWNAFRELIRKVTGIKLK